MNQTNLVEDLALLPLPPWWATPGFAAAVLASLAALGLLGWWLARRLRRPAPAPAPRPAPPIDLAAFLARLQALRNQRGHLSAYLLAIEASDILRAYLEARHGLRIRYQTSREFLREAATRPELTPAQRDALGDFLGFCDGVKFGQAPASDPEQDQLLATAERVVRETMAPSPTPAS